MRSTVFLVKQSNTKMVSRIIRVKIRKIFKPFKYVKSVSAELIQKYFLFNADIKWHFHNNQCLDVKHFGQICDNYCRHLHHSYACIIIYTFCFQNKRSWKNSEVVSKMQLKEWKTLTLLKKFGKTLVHIVLLCNQDTVYNV